MALNLNECMISGTVCEDPQVTGEGDGAWAFLKIMTTYGQKNADGSYSDVHQPVQIVTDIPHHVNTVRKYIKNGKALAVSGYYRTWEVNGAQHHGFFVRKFIFASANYGAENAAPAMPG